MPLDTTFTPLSRAGAPEDVGLSSERLRRINAVLEADVARKAIPGAVVAIARGGEIAYFEAFGFRDRDRQIPMQTGDIFRIASMTKPITSVAAMILSERGQLFLPDPVSKYLPAFKDVKVGVERLDSAGVPQLTRVDPEREMTVQDLMRHTSGLTYGLFGRSLVKSLYNQAGVFSLGITNAEMAAKLAELPLQHQPATTWDYGMSTDLLGHIVEVVSSKSLDVFLRDEILAPLSMHETGFLVSEESGDRIAQPQSDPQTGARTPMADPTRPARWLAGGVGMSGTAGDYLRFSQMLLNGGTLDGVRLLSRTSVALMTSDHLPPGVRFAPETAALFEAEAPTPEMGQSFGLGFAVRTDPGRNPLPGSVGDFYWAGALGTYFWIDPKEELIAVLMMQSPANRLHYRYLMRQLVYQALL